MGRKPRTSYNYRLILEFMDKQKKPIPSTLISRELNIPYSSIARNMLALVKQKRVKRLPGPAHSYLYKFLSYEREDIPDNSYLQSPILTGTISPIANDYLQKIVLTWGTEGWDPAVIKSTKTLMNTIAQIYKYALINVTQGESITDSDMLLLRNRLLQCEGYAESYLRFIQSLLATTEIWQGSVMPTFVLEGLDIDTSASRLEHLQSVIRSIETQSN